MVAVLLLVGGAGLFFVCEFNGWHLHEHGGHVWYLVGIAVAAGQRVVVRVVRLGATEQTCLTVVFPVAG